MRKDERNINNKTMQHSQSQNSVNWRTHGSGGILKTERYDSIYYTLSGRQSATALDPVSVQITFPLIEDQYFSFFTPELYIQC